MGDLCSTTTTTTTTTRDRDIRYAIIILLWSEPAYIDFQDSNPRQTVSVSRPPSEEMGRPTLFQRVRHTLGRALRETGQALDRLGLRGEAIVTSKRVIGDEPVKYEDFLSRHRQQMPLLRRGRPRVSKDVAFLAPCSTLIGSVYVGAGSSIWYKAILRADNCDNAESFNLKGDEYSRDEQLEWELDPDRESRQHSRATGGGIFIGENTNIQDGCIIDAVKDHTRIGNGVTVGHLASIHSATIHDNCLIGMGSLLQEGVVVKPESLIAAGANVPANTIVESGELWVGNPARKIRDLTAAERQRLHYQASEYVGVASGHRDIMNLGGNLPDSLSGYLEFGHDTEEAAKESSKDKETKEATA